MSDGVVVREARPEEAERVSWAAERARLIAKLRTATELLMMAQTNA